MPLSSSLAEQSLRKSLLCTSIAMALFSMQAHSQSDTPDIDEVLVTGSYLRGSALDGPSPVQVIDRAGIEAQGAAQIWDVIKNLQVNSGSISNPGSGEEDFIEGIANVNLRNLGENSTLTLVNGRRQVSAAATTRSGGEMVDINAIPLVMLERMEVLTDGGSALYGSDAVAGVVNMIMRTEFEGLELYADIQNVEKAGSLFDKTGSGIWGWASDSGDTHLVLAGERYERDAVPVTEARYFNPSARSSDIVGSTPTAATAVFNNPAFGANFNAAYLNNALTARNIAEGGLAEPVYTDPLCTSLRSVSGDAFFAGQRSDSRGENSGNCREFVDEFDFMTLGTERDSLAASFSHRFSEQAEFYSFAQWSDSRIRRSDSGAVAARGPTVFLAAPGSHIGLPQLGGYAVGQTAELGFFAPAAGLAAPRSVPNAPNALANGGMNVPLFANVRLNTPRTGGDTNVTDTNTVSLQTGLKGEFTAFTDREFSYDVGLSWSGTSFEQRYRTLQRDRTELAANGLGGPGCTPNGTKNFDFRNFPGPLGGLLPTFWNVANGALGDGLTQTFFPGFAFMSRESLSLALTSNNHGQGGCQFYNPFLTALTNPALANSQELADWMSPVLLRADKRNALGVLDAVVTGELFELQGGTARFAAGAQYRRQTNKSRAPEINLPGIPNAILGYDARGVPDEFHYLSNNLECSYCIFNYANERNVKAVFTELSLPVLSDVETQLALRWESYGGGIGSEVTPKLAASWRVREDVLLRGSWSQSFRAPNVGIVEEGFEAASITFRDPLRNQAVRAGLLPPTNENAQPNQTYTLGAPAPNVGNERADTFSAGFIWTPEGRLDGLSVNADVWRFELEDKVLPQPGISAIAGEIAAFQQAAANPANYVLNSTLSGNTPVPFETCSPAALEAQFGRNSEERLDCVVDPRRYMVPGVVRAFGSPVAQLTTTVLSTINAGTIITDGVDVKIGYAWDNGLGNFRLALDYTHVRQYRLIDVPGLELGLLETGEFDAAGTTGDGNLVRSLPDNRGSVSLFWSRERHDVALVTRLIGSYRDLAYQNVWDRGSDEVRALVSKQIDSYQSWDLQYSYAHDWSDTRLGSAVLTLGVLDLFNARIPYREIGDVSNDASVANYDASVFDARGRRLYARLLLQL